MGLMNRLHKAALLGLAVALPAAAHEFQAFRAIPPEPQPCFAAGPTTYQVSTTTLTPTYKVKIDNHATHPGLRMQLVDDPAAADFVLADDSDAAASAACHTSMPLKTIRIDDAAARPDLTISLAGGDAAPDFRLYVHSARFSHEEAAALFGVMWQAAHPRSLAKAQALTRSRR
jgi:hypothetical protein